MEALNHEWQTLADISNSGQRTGFENFSAVPVVACAALADAQAVALDFEGRDFPIQHIHTSRDLDRACTLVSINPPVLGSLAITAEQVQKAVVQTLPQDVAEVFPLPAMLRRTHDVFQYRDREHEVYIGDAPFRRERTCLVLNDRRICEPFLLPGDAWRGLHGGK